MSKEEISQGFEAREEEKKKQKMPVYTAKELKSMEFHFDRMNKARNIRQQQRAEFDDMDFDTDYEQNQRASYSYLRRKRNDDEVRVNTGTTEKKIEIIVNELLGMNFESEVLAFDEMDREYTELGDGFTEIIKRTKEQENYDDLRKEIYLEMVTQRIIYLEEIFEEDYRIGRKKIGRVKRILNDGRQIYPGDFNLPARDFDFQPFIVKYERMQIDQAKRLYGGLPTWDFVQSGSPSNSWYGGFYSYRMNPLKDMEVEVLKYMSALDNEYQIYINSVPMFPFGSRLPWGYDGYNISAVVVKPVSRTLLPGKSLVSSSKFLQALSDESIRLLIRKWRQALEPPIGVLAKKIYSKDIWSPGAQTIGVSKDNFSRLIDHDGVTQSEFAMMDFIQRKTEEFIGRSDLQQGIQGKRMTATQTIELQKQAIKNLGLIVLSAMSAEKLPDMKRIMNILENYTKPISKNVDKKTGEILEEFRQFTIEDSTFPNGKSGRKIIGFTSKSMTEKEEKDLVEFEDHQEVLGNPIRIKKIDKNAIKSVNIEWFISVISKDKDSSALEKVLFSDMFQGAVAVAQATGEKLNAGKLTSEFERRWKMKDLFQTVPSTTEGIPQIQTGQPNTAVEGRARELLGNLEKIGGTKRPSLNQMI